MMHSQVIELLKELHNLPNAGFYELAAGVAGASLLVQYLAKRKGNVELEKLLKGLTLAGLGCIFIECIMTVLHEVGGLFGL